MEDTVLITRVVGAPRARVYKAWIAFSDSDGDTKVDMTLTLEKVHGADMQREGWGGMLAHLDTRGFFLPHISGFGTIPATRPLS